MQVLLNNSAVAETCRRMSVSSFFIVGWWRLMKEPVFRSAPLPAPRIFYSDSVEIFFFNFIIFWKKTRIHPNSLELAKSISIRFTRKIMRMDTEDGEIDDRNGWTLKTCDDLVMLLFGRSTQGGEGRRGRFAQAAETFRNGSKEIAQVRPPLG